MGIDFPSEYNRIALSSFGRYFPNSSEKVKEVFQAVEAKVVTFLNLEEVYFSKEFITDVIIGLLCNSEKLIFVGGSEEQINVIYEILIDLQVVDKVSFL